MNAASDKDRQLRLDAARWWLLSHHPFYAQLTMRLRDVLDDTISPPTACTNGREIRWHRAFLDTLTVEELRGVLLHETLHCAHLHLWRLPATPAGNVAGDHEINLTLQALAPDVQLPAGALADAQYRDLACEEILARLPKDRDGNASGAGDPSTCGTFSDPGDAGAPGSENGAEPGAPGDASSLRDAWETATIAAAHLHDAGRGDLPGDMARQLSRILAQPIDWRRVLIEFARDAVSQRNDWTRSSRRHATSPVIMPRKRVDSISCVLFVRDTSGSIDDATCAAFSAAIDACIAEIGCNAIVVDCDAAIQATHRLSPGTPCPLRALGGGGTDFRPPFKFALECIEAGEHVAGVVYLTDLYGRFPDPSPDMPTLWIATRSHLAAAPFGRVVVYA